MIWRLWSVCFIALMIFSCTSDAPLKEKRNITKNTLAFSYKTIKQNAADCGNKRDTGCTYAKIVYPEFDRKPQLNDTITRKIITLLGAGDLVRSSNLNTYSKNFLQSYLKAKQSNPRIIQIYALNNYAKVLRQDSCLLTLEIGGYALRGEAGSLSAIHFINWNTIQNKEVTLKDLFKAGYQIKLTVICESIYRNNQKSGDTTLHSDYSFKRNRFTLNDNYLITPLGIRFLYNKGETRPVSEGVTNLFIPYSQISSLLRPHTVLAQYIK